MDITEKIDFICEQHASAFYAKYRMNGYGGYTSYEQQMQLKDAPPFIELQLKKRGYVRSSSSTEWTKGFVVVGFTLDKFKVSDIYIYHDIGKEKKPVFIRDSHFTGLPIALSYMERNML